MLCKKTQGKLYTFRAFEWQREEEGEGVGLIAFYKACTCPENSI